MEEEKGVVKHISLSKFKDDTTPERIEEFIKAFANLVNVIPSMKSFHWGKDISTENLNQGFTHVFEVTFESMEGIEEFIVDPAHVEFVKLFAPNLEKFIIIDYKPTVVNF